MTHLHLNHGVHCEIINFIDDYSRAALASVAVTTATATDVVRVFFDAAATYGQSSRTPKSATTKSIPPAASPSGTAHASTTSGSAEHITVDAYSSSFATSTSESSPTTANNSDTPHPQPHPRLPATLERYRSEVRLSQKPRDRTKVETMVSGSTR